MIEIDTHRIGGTNRPFVIAEAGTNFRGDVTLGKAFVDAAAEAGADAVKFQTLDPETALSRSGLATLGMENLYDGLAAKTLSRGDHEELQAHCQRRDVTFLSTPFCPPAVDLLDELDVPAIKIGSGELTNFHLLKTAAETGRPLLVSTGMADMETIGRSCEFLANHTDSFALLYCVSLYPASLDDLDLVVIDRLKDRFDVPVGFSDHTRGVEAPAIAMARGADFVEKHFTIDRRLPGGDQDVSLEPDEFERLVEYADAVVATDGDEKRVHQGERDVAEWAHHSVVAAERLEPGDVLTEDNVTTKRPGTGIPASRFYEVIGESVSVGVDPDTVLTTDHLD